jgi:hypothetical protein
MSRTKSLLCSRILLGKSKMGKIFGLMLLTIFLAVAFLGFQMVPLTRSQTPEIRVTLLNPLQNIIYRSNVIYVTFVYSDSNTSNPVYRLYLDGVLSYFTPYKVDIPIPMYSLFNETELQTKLNLPDGDHDISVSVEANLNDSSPFTHIGYSQVVHFTVRATPVLTPDIPTPSPSPTLKPTTTPTFAPTPPPSPSPPPTIEPTPEPTRTPNPTTDNVLAADFTPAIILGSIATIALVVGVLIYFKKRKRS